MKKLKFVLCINNKNEDDLTKFKVYQVLPDDSANKDNYLRIIDDSEKDYLYPASYFMVIELPEIIEDIALSKAIEKGEETELVDRESISLKFMI